MARKILEERFVRKLTKGSRGSMYVVIPVEMIRARKWKPRQKLVVKSFGKGILIEDYDPKKDK